MAHVTGGTPEAPPVVYLGPSAPREEIAAVLPQAVFRPPIRRGDLYRDRILRFSVFLIIDGVFAQEEAIPPREVVDVLQDGGRVLGASSMGALRACDCAVAGAQGIGTLYRLFRTGAINSEDEVAVTFRPDRPYPALTLSLASVRIALRRAVRGGMIDRADARRLAEAAAGHHYSDRTWDALSKAISSPIPADVLTSDAKREDALRAARVVARRLTSDPGWGHRPRRGAGKTFRALTDAREKALEIGHWLDPGSVPGFVVWSLASGRAAAWLAPGETALALLQSIDAAIPSGAENVLFTQAGEIDQPAELSRLFSRLRETMQREDAFEAEVLRYCAASSLALHNAPGIDPNTLDLSLAEMQIAQRHGIEGWTETLTAAGGASSALVRVRDRIARGMSFRSAELLYGR